MLEYFIIKMSRPGCLAPITVCSCVWSCITIKIKVKKKKQPSLLHLALHNAWGGIQYRKIRRHRNNIFKNIHCSIVFLHRRAARTWTLTNETKGKLCLIKAKEIFEPFKKIYVTLTFPASLLCSAFSRCLVTGKKKAGWVTFVSFFLSWFFFLVLSQGLLTKDRSRWVLTGAWSQQCEKC